MSSSLIVLFRISHASAVIGVFLSALLHFHIVPVSATYRYYGPYLSYATEDQTREDWFNVFCPTMNLTWSEARVHQKNFANRKIPGELSVVKTGDTIISTFHYHGGSKLPNRKWNIECLDGEAVVEDRLVFLMAVADKQRNQKIKSGKAKTLSDLTDDFERIQFLWCKFMFPYKPPSKGDYPYYPYCISRNISFNFFCYDRHNSSHSMNTFVTGLWDDEFNFFLFRPVVDLNTAMKCCKTPPGYYIDYTSCYFMPTHDQYGEYYDSNFNFIVTCASGFVVTGMAAKKSPVTTYQNLDWIQCCRIGYGAPVALPPPVTSYGRHGYLSYSAQGSTPSVGVPNGYQAQYRTFTEPCGQLMNVTRCASSEDRTKSTWSKHYTKPSQSTTGRGFAGA